jgi:hypothetical protein
MHAGFFRWFTRPDCPNEVGEREWRLLNLCLERGTDELGLGP